MKQQQIRRFYVGDLIQIFIGSNAPIYRSYTDKSVETTGVVIDIRQYPGGRRKSLQGIARDVGYIDLFVLDNNYRNKHTIVQISFRSIVNAYRIAGVFE